MKNKDYIEYTYKHRKIVIYLAKKYFKKNKDLLKKVELHDLDKLFMYLFYEKESASDIHRDMISHHQNSIPKTELDYMEMVLDWESARYTKPDKPLNAYDTLIKYYPDMEDNILPILKSIGIDKSGLPMEEDVWEYTQSISEVTLDDIKKEFITYVRKIVK
jgi:hypothetical protein